MISTLLWLFGSVYNKDTCKGLFLHNLSLPLQDHHLTLLVLLLTFSIYLDLILALALLAAHCFSLCVLSLPDPCNPLSALCSPCELYFHASGHSMHLLILSLFTHLHSPIQWLLVFPSSLTPFINPALCPMKSYNTLSSTFNMYSKMFSKNSGMQGHYSHYVDTCILYI